MLVVGGGPIGIGAAIAALRREAGVIVSEPDAHRRAVLAALGVEAIAPEAVAAGAADVALECVGLPATVAAALAGVRPGGTVVMVGIAEPVVPVSVAPLVMEERALVGSAVYTRADFAATAAWIDAGAIDLAPRHRAPGRRSTSCRPRSRRTRRATERATKTLMIGAAA